jgi:TPR repeat protein
MKHLLALALLAGPVAAQDLGSAVARMEAAMTTDPILATCPADLFQTRATLLDRLFGDDTVFLDVCRQDPVACATACVDDSSAADCLSLALMLEIDATPHLLPARHAYGLACALGDPAGCTNRAAGIRNVPLEGDALSLLPFDDKADCLFRSFRLACDHGDSWGCTMLGQAYHYGEGTPRDPGLAKASYTKACTIAAPDLDFPSCTFARDAMATLP